MSSNKPGPTDTIEQACVIPYRNSGRRMEVCLITSIKKKKWIFPKGIVDPGETVEESALKEAWEEAGIRGSVGEIIANYEDHKWGSRLNVNVMLMQVEETASEWPEQELRQREWLSVAKAKQRLSHETHKQLLKHLK